MKKKVYTIFCCLFISNYFIAQETLNRFSFGIGSVKNEYDGDWGSLLFNFKMKTFYATSAYLSYYLSPSFEIGLEASKGKYGYFIDEVQNFEGGKNDIFLMTHYKFNDINLSNVNSKISPFISIGVGMANYYIDNQATPWPTILLDKNDFVYGAGIGFNLKLTKSLSLRYKFSYNITNNDIHDQNRTGIIDNYFGTQVYPHSKKGNDNYAQQFLYLSYFLSNPFDKDGDGVRDKYQKFR